MHNGKELVGAGLVAARPACKPPFPRGPIHNRTIPSLTKLVQLCNCPLKSTLAL